MRTLKDLLLIFFVGLGIHRAVQDVFAWIDPELVVDKDAGYFSVIAFMVLYFAVKYLRTRDQTTNRQTETTN